MIAFIHQDATTFQEFLFFKKELGNSLLKKSLGNFKDCYVLPCYLTKRIKLAVNTTKVIRFIQLVRPFEKIVESATSFPKTLAIVVNITKCIVKG